MTDTELFNQTVKFSGLKYRFIASCLNISVNSLKNKIDNVTEFKASEISELTATLNLSKEIRDKIFFAQFSDFKSTK